MLLVVRLAGKRTIREGTPFDFLVALMLGDFPDDVIWGEVPVAQGVVAIGSVMRLHVMVSYASYRSPWFDRLLGASPAPLLRRGLSDRQPAARSDERERPGRRAAAGRAAQPHGHRGRLNDPIADRIVELARTRPTCPSCSDAWRSATCHRPSDTTARS
jgi:hypothetical protein